MPRTQSENSDRPTETACRLVIQNAEQTMSSVPLLRDYQFRAKDALIFGWEEYNRLLIQMPTGSGKGFWSAVMIGELLPERCLFLADADHLLDQIVAHIEERAGVIPAIEKARRKASLGAKVVVATVQSLTQKGRKERYPEDYFKYIFSDEQHRISSGKAKIFDYFKSAKICGMTATPWRSNMKDLSQWFDHVAFEMKPIDMVQQGYAPPLRVMTMPIEIDLDGVETKRTSGGKEYDEQQLSTTIEPYYEKICELLIEHASDRFTVVFLPLVESSKAFAEIARRSGIQAVHVDGSTPDRVEILERFRRGQIRMLCNAQVIETGVDIPRADCFVNLKVTKSTSSYIQRLGRVMRVLPGVIDGINDPEERKKRIAASEKPDALVIDFLFQNDRLGVMHPGHIYAQDAKEAVLIYEKTKKIRTPEELLEIAQRVQQEREFQLVKKIEDAATKSGFNLDPRAWASMCGQKGLVSYEPIARWECQPPSDAQLIHLEKWGIDTTKVDSKGLAARLMDLAIHRFKFQLATPGQLRALYRLEAPIDPLLTKQDASELIAQLKLARVRKAA